MWSDEGLKQLASWGISATDAEAAGIYEVANAREEADDAMQPLPALVLPYFTVNGDSATYGDNLPFFRLRYLAEPAAPRSFVKKKPLRYAQPAESGVRAYFPVAGFDWRPILTDTKTEIILTEGEAKGLACCLAGLPCIAFGGVFNWLAGGPNDARILLPELEEFVWRGRNVYIVFDSDAALNPNIQGAEARLVDELMRDRGAKVHVVRLPPGRGGVKVGLDDYLQANGVDRLQKLLMATEPLGAVDAAIMALNRHVCWVERDSQVYDVAARHFLKTEGFTRGSKYSAEKVRRIVTTGKNPGVKEVAVAAEWLTHPLARRYADLLFRPGEGLDVETEHGSPALNAWHGWHEAPGDVTPFLDLTEFLMQNLRGVDKELPLKLIAYKAQHPAEKIPLSLVLVGDQGSGKSLWASCVSAAFAPYGVVLQSDSLTSQFQGWLERSLLAIINEAEAEDITAGYPRLRALISDLDRPMNEKFRVPRQIKSYTFYILTANERAAGAFPIDDRRMIVIGCPAKVAFWPIERYRAVKEWRDAGGGAALMHYLLNYDLKNWQPPREAPLTPEKAMSYQEALSPVQRLADDTVTAQGHTIIMWIDQALTWAHGTIGGPNAAQAKYAQEIIDAYSTVQIRPFYSPDELAMMFPQIAASMYGNKKMKATTSGEISRQLRDAGVPYLECSDDPRGFLWRGRRQQFLVLADRADWREPLPQVEFERLMKEFPRYSDWKAAEKAQVKRRAANEA